MFRVDGQQVNCKLILCEFDSHLSIENGSIYVIVVELVVTIHLKCIAFISV